MLRDQTTAEASASGGAYRDAATYLPARIEPMIGAVRQRLGTAMDEPARQIEPAFASATGPWPPATR
jgi:hypothetical protein